MLSCRMLHGRMIGVSTIIGFLLVYSVAFHPTASDPSDAVPEDIPASTLIYVSDYFSFVGEDDKGHVAFALDNNRGRDGDAYQGEHFLVLHDERQGWVKLAGNGLFQNTNGDLRTIPDSPFFRFQGTPRTGLTITSDVHLSIIIRTKPSDSDSRHDSGVVRS